MIRTRQQHEVVAKDALWKIVQGHKAGTPWLPLPAPTGASHLPASEWLLYRRLQAQQTHETLDYPTTFWNRPTPGAARAAWELLALPMGLTLDDLRDTWPSLWNPTAGEKLVDDVTAMQAFTLVLATAVNLGRARRLLTQNQFLGALYEAWSDHWRLAREEGRAVNPFHLIKETDRGCRRDLLRSRISVPKLWDLLAKYSTKDGSNPLFLLESISEDPGLQVEDDAGAGASGRRHGGAYRVRLHEGIKDLRDFTDLLNQERWSVTRPRYTNPFEHLPIKISRKRTRARRPGREIIAETPFNIVTTGSGTEETIKALEEALVLLDSITFGFDYCNADTIMADVRRRLRQEYGLGKGVLSKHHRRIGGHKISSFREQAIRAARRRKQITKEDEDTVRAYLTKYDAAEWIHTQFARGYEQVHAQQATRGPVRVRSLALEPPPTPVLQPFEIYSDFRKVSNRRYQPDHFHLSAVTSDPWDDAEAPVSLVAAMVPDYATAIRFRWFKAPALPGSDETTQELVGYDVTSSQIQIIAMLAGLAQLEASFAGGGDFRKDALAPAAYPHMRSAADGYKTGYTGPGDARLADAMKNMVMTKFYGRKLTEVVKAHAADPATFGPGWKTHVRRSEARELAKTLLPKMEKEALARWAGLIEAGKAMKSEEQTRKDAARNARRRAIQTLATRDAAARADVVLDSMPDREGVEKFLMACRQVALRAYHENEKKTKKDNASAPPAVVTPAAGTLASVTLTDPLDAADENGGTFTWNPIPYNTIRFSNGGIGPTVGVPKPKESARSKLQNMLSPCWVHCLDSFFLSLVVRRLAQMGLQCFATVHDCVYVPEKVLVEGAVKDGLEVLELAMTEAAEEWFEGLAPVFEDLARYLGDDRSFIKKPKGWRLAWTKQTYGDYARDLQRRWQDRVAAAKDGRAPWPRFAVKASRR